MRNAAAAFDDDYASDEPVRRSKPARKARGGAKKKSALRRFGGRPALHYAAIGLSASLAVGIMVNALVLQHNRHPAPLFGKAIVLGDASAPAAMPPIPATASPAGPAPAIVTPPAPGIVPVQAAPRPHHAASEAPAPAKSSHDDPIAKLLKTSGADKTTPDKVAKDSAKTVLATQHALVKLGFVVKASGTFGPGTKSAIEAFERDRHLPVKGEMSRKTLKQISADSGIPID